MNRRQFLVRACALPLVATLPSLGQTQNETTNQLGIEKRLDMDSFIQEISKYDLIHFGEEHPNPASRTTETTTLEDFLEFFLPKLRDEKLANKPHELLRTEHLPYEIEAGRQFIPQIEFAAFDKSGIIDPINTPTLFKEVLQSGVYKDPYGSIKIAREGTRLGFKVRGLSMPLNKLILYDRIFRECAKELTPEKIAGLSSMFGAYIVTENHLEALRADMQSGKRVVVYGGALHNDNNDLYGIADEMQKEFPGRYVSIDLEKHSTAQKDLPSFKYCAEILRAEGIPEDGPNKIVILKMKNSPLANYIVFLPKRQNKNP